MQPRTPRGPCRMPVSLPVINLRAAVSDCHFPKIRTLGIHGDRNVTRLLQGSTFGFPCSLIILRSEMPFLMNPCTAFGTTLSGDDYFGCLVILTSTLVKSMMNRSRHLASKVAHLTFRCKIVVVGSRRGTCEPYQLGLGHWTQKYRSVNI